jgi:hypothetical protein
MRLRPQLANRQQIASTLGKTGNHGKSSTPAFLANSWNMPDCAGVVVWTPARLRMFVEATMAKTSHTTRTTSRKSPTRWSAEVIRHSNALDLKRRVFTLKDPKRIAGR